MYLLPSSCHPPTCTKNIPFSLCLRIVRICSKTENREVQFLKLKELLENRGYSGKTVDRAIERARGIPRHVSLRRVLRPQEERRPVFALTYDPRLPPIQNIQAKHWRSMISQDPYLNEVIQNHLLQHLGGRGMSETTWSGLRCQQTPSPIHLEIREG